MDYVGQIIRPPSEADSIILQVTVGCSHNKCTFCGAYKDKKFALRSEDDLAAGLEFAKAYCTRQKRVFLADGDALILPFSRLKGILISIRSHLPWVRRISLYASARSIRSKTEQQLAELKSLGLDRLYLGLESGCDEILATVRKGETSSSMIKVAGRVRSAGLFLSVTVLLGLGGRSGSSRHAQLTAAVLNSMHPNQVAALTLMPLGNTPLGEACLRGDFQLPSAKEILAEMKILVDKLDCRTQFHANHASNYLPIAGRLPSDKERILNIISSAVHAEHELVPERLRSL